MIRSSLQPLGAKTSITDRLASYLACACLLVSALLASCQSKGTAASSGAAEHLTSIQDSDTVLVGKRLYLSFPSNRSVVEYVSPQRLYWSSEDSVHGYKEGDDLYHAVQIEPHVFFVNWAEDDGTTVSQVIDFKERTVQAFISSSVYGEKSKRRKTVVLSGSIDRVEGAHHILFD